MRHTAVPFFKRRPVAATLVLSLQIGLGLAAAPASAQTPAPSAQAPAPHALRLARFFEAWRDELPATLDAAQVEVVLLTPDSRCRPPATKGLFGMSVVNIHPITNTFCRRLESFTQKPPAPLPLPTRLGTQALNSRQPAEIVAALDPPPQRRYVALVVWDWSTARNDTKWVFEEAVIDRETGRWVWHAARAYDITHVRDYTARDEVDALRSLLQHDLPRDVLNRKGWQADAPVPDSRWVPLAGQADWRPGEQRAGLVVVNTYSRNSDIWDSVTAQIWPHGTAEISPQRGGDMSQARVVTRPQTTPLLPTFTYALLDLPAGDYALKVYTDLERLRLEPGRITVLNVHRSALGNAKTFTLEPEAWWRRKVEEGDLRHAFLAEPLRAGKAIPAPYFLPAATGSETRP